MLRTRVIPILLLHNESLVKTINFNKLSYIGDPSNTVRIFNELEVDELIFLDIAASHNRRSPNLKILAEISNECFMPLGYGGGIRSLDDARAVLDIGFEKIALNSHALENPDLIDDIARHYGSQAVIASIDVKKTFLGNSRVFTLGGRRNTGRDPVSWAKEVESRGAGEILLTSINREGSWKGFDVDLIKAVTDSVAIPVIAHGGASCIHDISEAVKTGNASAVGLGSMVVYQKQAMGVLVNFPDIEVLEKALI